MRNHRIVALVVVVVVTALIAGYFLGRRPTTVAVPAPVPRAATSSTDLGRASSRTKDVIRSVQRIAAAKPMQASAASAPTLNDVYPDLKARADANDASAASELYHDLQRCNRVKELSHDLPLLIPNLLDSDTSKESPETMQQRERMLDSIQKELDYVKRNEAFCANVDDSTMQQYVPSSLKAAQLGDIRATRCYLGGSMNFTSGLLDHPEWLTDFKQNAMSLADQGIQRGDWGVAGLLGHAYAGYFSSSFLAQLTGNDPVKAYRYLKLQLLGATDTFVDKLDKQLAQAADGLSSDQLAQADAWAQSTYAAHFSGTTSNELSNGVNVCGGFDDD